MRRTILIPGGGEVARRAGGVPSRRVAGLARPAISVVVWAWLLAGGASAQEHMHPGMEPGRWWHLGVHGVALGTHVRNGVGAEPVTEGYLTQPSVMAGGSFWGGRVSALTTLSLEGLTLQRGELAPGSYGEGYVDRRHPHTYLHEALLTLRTPEAGGAAHEPGAAMAAAMREPRGAMAAAGARDAAGVGHAHDATAGAGQGHDSMGVAGHGREEQGGPAGASGGRADSGGRTGMALSLTAGRGFAPFGTDDPMVRPFVRFPVNHHLGQVLERLVLIGAVRRGPVILEAGLFSGDEPSNPEDLGTPARFGDSWAVRATVVPVRGLELQASRAQVKSPELPLGGGWDQRKWSGSARYEAPLGAGSLYGLMEWARTAELNGDETVFSFGSVLGETSYAIREWKVGARVERTDRPEEDRLSAYRTPWPHGELHVLGITRWTVGSLMAERALSWGGLRVAPFTEVALAHVGERERGLFEVARTYGGTRIWSVSAGARVDVGVRHARMGRYGVALP